MILQENYWKKEKIMIKYRSIFERRGIMSSIYQQQPITEMSHVKVFVLYLMHEIGYPLTYTSISDIAEQDGYVMHIDFVNAFAECLEQGLLEVVEKVNNEELFFTTQKGMIVAEQLASRIGSNILKTSIKSALRYLDFQKRHVVLECDDKMIGDGSVELTVQMKDNTKILLSVTVNVPNSAASEAIKKRFREMPEATYRGVYALLNGNVDYLFDSEKEFG